MQEAKLPWLHTVLFHSFDLLEKAKLQEQKLDQWLPEAGNVGKGLTAKGGEGMLCSDGNVLYLISIVTVVVVTQLHTSVKIHQTTTLKIMKFIISLFYLNNVCKLSLNKFELYLNKFELKIKQKRVKVGKDLKSKLADSFL